MPLYLVCIAVCFYTHFSVILCDGFGMDVFRLRLFKSFDSFRILVCGGDGTVGWVLTEIDKMELHKQVC